MKTTIKRIINTDENELLLSVVLKLLKKLETYDQHFDFSLNRWLSASVKEVTFESHVVTALTKSTKHLILIGDHQQLKPNPTVYELVKKYNLEISLFERMIKNGLPYHQLKVQHRMRPCISSLLVPNIYKELRDHPSVKEYDDIKGMISNAQKLEFQVCL